MRENKFHGGRNGLFARATIVLALLAQAARADSFFATTIVAYEPGPGVTSGQGFGVVDRILGGPRGAGLSAGSLDVLTLGVGGSVTLGFDAPDQPRLILDGPGADFIVFENPFFIGATGNVFAELAFVEVSSDGQRFARFPVLSATPSPLGPTGGINPSNAGGFAGVRPVLANADSNMIDPFDAAAAGGDAFDLAALADDPMVRGGAVRLGEIRYVRIIDVLGNGSALDALGRPIYDPTGLNNSCDIDAVSVIHGRSARVPGDLNGDGAVDGADAVLLVAMLLEPASASAAADLNGDGAVDGDDVQPWVNEAAN